MRFSTISFRKVGQGRHTVEQSISDHYPARVLLRKGDPLSADRPRSEHYNCKSIPVVPGSQLLRTFVAAKSRGMIKLARKQFAKALTG
jgi:hypothetical protein